MRRLPIPAAAAAFVFPFASAFSFAFHRVALLLTVLPALLLTACAPRQLSPNAPAAGRVDAVVVARDQVLLFDFGRRLYQRWDRISFHTAPLPPPQGGRWLTLPSPRTTEAFLPVDVAAGPAGNLFVLDAGGRRIWQYDTLMRPITGLALPARLSRAPASDLLLAWSRRDGLLALAPSEGRAYTLHEAFGELRMGREAPLPSGVGRPMGCFGVGLAGCLWDSGWYGEGGIQASAPVDLRDLGITHVRGPAGEGESALRLMPPEAAEAASVLSDRKVRPRTVCYFPRRRVLTECADR